MDPVDPVTAALACHERTGHHPHRFARALPYLDWDTQPDPYRHFEGAPITRLDLVPPSDEPRYEPAFLLGAIPPRPLDRASVSQLFYDSLALSAWKQADSARWALRVNPSSGNLHPTEGYLLAGPVPGLSEEPAVWHYSPWHHGLERRAALSPAAWAALAGELPREAVLVGLSSIYLRESWKYGERAFRYCQHDVGHAIGALAIAAAGLGWDCRLLEGALDPELDVLLGVGGQTGPEAERPECLLALFPSTEAWPLPAWASWRVPPRVLAELGRARWEGTPRPLASDHHPWPLVDAFDRATRKEAPPPAALWEPVTWENRALEIGDSPLSLRRIVRQRRSAVDMDGRTGITAAAFYQVLVKTLPGRGQVPFQALPWRPRVHLALWVHRVVGLDPGLYLLVREPEAEATLRAALRPDFSWSRPPGCPDALPLFLLARGDRRAEASGASCGQAIAADGCFAVAMLAPLAPTLRALGAPFYRRLHWEAGLVGQVLYLEAEATGVRATGIGCFFDDVTHRALGADPDHQVLYHFTVGGPVSDPRLQTLDAYVHLDAAR